MRSPSPARSEVQAVKGESTERAAPGRPGALRHGVQRDRILREVLAGEAERFRSASTLDVSSLEVWIGQDQTIRVDSFGEDGRSYLTVAQARTLRDWLTSALPCEHFGSRTGFGDTSGQMRETCKQCGAVLVDTSAAALGAARGD
jgi:hypothetical protein